jgi:flagellar biosynthesis/type III secretory pathway M-ring protein FliF/YscJ
VEPAKEIAPPPQTVEDVRKQIEGQLAANAAQKELEDLEALKALQAPPKTQRSEVLSKHIGEEAKKDPQAIANILRTWLNEPE